MFPLWLIMEAVLDHETDDIISLLGSPVGVTAVFSLHVRMHGTTLQSASLPDLSYLDWTCFLDDSFHYRLSNKK